MKRIEPAMNSSIGKVLAKWIEGNSVVDALLNNRGSFFDMIRELAIHRQTSTQPPSSDHGYVTTTKAMSFAEYVNRIEDNQFDIKEHLINFRPTSSDTERMFSLGRLSKNYLQTRLSPENHSRNLFLAKNKQFFNLEV